MAICGNEINVGVSNSCDNKSIGGLEQDAIILINRSEIDLATTVVNRNSATGVHNISALNLVPGAVVFPFEGIGSKRVLKASYSKNDGGDTIDTFIHSVDVVVYNQCEESLSLLNKFVNGADVVAIVQQKSKGLNNSCAFQIYGFHSGLKAGDFTYNSNENNGVVLLNLSSKDPDNEAYAPYKYEEIDYATTVVKIESLK